MKCGVYEHQPGYGGVCKVCGQEVMTPVDDSGDALTDEQALAKVFEQMFDLEMGVCGALVKAGTEARAKFFELAKDLTKEQAAEYHVYRLAQLGWRE